jgi:hypothetical protein
MSRELDIQEIKLSPKQNEFFIKMWRADDASVKILGAEYQLYMQLKKILPLEIIDFINTKRKK